MKRLALPCLLALALTGCGSTVQQYATAQAPGELGAPGTAPTTTSTTSTTGSLTPGDTTAGLPSGLSQVDAGSTSSGVVSGSQLPGPAASRAAVAAPLATRAGTFVPAPGITAQEVRIGALVVTSETDAQLGTFGASGSYGNGEGYYRAVIADVNKNGGVLGRRLVASYRPISIVGDYNSQVEAHCRAFTEDDAVVAAAANSLVTDGWDDCLHKHRTLSLNASAYRSSADLQRLQGTFILGSPAIEQEFGPSYVSGLQQAGAFAQGAKFGILYTESKAYDETVERQLEPALKRAGLPVALTFGMSPLQSSGDIGSLSSQAQSAVLQFRQAGVTNVLSVLDHSAGLGYFISAAEDQGYEPKYGMTSRYGPGLSSAAAYAPRLFAVGTRPHADVRDFTRSAAPQYQRCLKVITSAGIAAPTPENGLEQALATCDFVWFLKAALEKAPVLSYEGIIAGAQSLGTSWQSATTPRVDLHSGSWTAAAAYRAVRFQESCHCMGYVTASQSLA